MELCLEKDDGDKRMMAALLFRSALLNTSLGWTMLALIEPPIKPAATIAAFSGKRMMYVRRPSTSEIVKISLEM
jgi:hypothetical protein